MKKSTSKLLVSVGVIAVIAFLASPLLFLPEGFIRRNESAWKHYLRGVSYMTARMGANSCSSRVLEAVQETPPSRIILQFDFSSPAELKAIDEAVFSYPKSLGLGVVQSEVDHRNGKYLLETDRSGAHWFEAKVAKVKSHFGPAP